MQRTRSEAPEDIRQLYQDEEVDRKDGEFLLALEFGNVRYRNDIICCTSVQGSGRLAPQFAVSSNPVTMATIVATGRAHNWTAAGYMLLMVASLSVTPLLITLAHAADYPFLFNSGWRFGVVIGCLLFLLTSYWSPRGIKAQFGELKILPLIRRRVFKLAILLAIIGTFDYALFTLSTGFVDISVTTVLYSLWPISVIFLLERLFRQEKRYREITPTTYWLIAFGLSGFILVVDSRGEGFGVLDSTPFTALIIGVTIAIIGALATSLASFSFKWSSEIVQELHVGVISYESSDPSDKRVGSLELFCLVIAYTIANSVSAPINAIIGVTSGESINFGPLVIAILGGVLIQSTGSILWRKANVITVNLGINALVYAIPVFSLIWLAAFADLNVDRVDYLVIGAAAIIAANLLINFGAERLLGFKALVLSLWACGMFVYLRDVGRWIWIGADTGYFDALALSATVFTLILSFRVARLANRTRDEDNRAFGLIRELNALARRGLIGGEVCEYILAINESHGPELQNAYNKARQCIAVALRRASHQEQDKLIAMEAELDSLTHSRQQGINFGELCALGIFASLTVFLALFSRPEVSGLTAFLIEVFTILFSAVIVFLTVNIWDLQQDRIARLMESRSVSMYSEYGLVFQDRTNRTIEQGISIVVGLLIVGAYVGLLGHKWLGWFGG